MAMIEVFETQGPVSAKPEVPGAGAVLKISVRAAGLIEWPSVDLTFDKPILSAVLHMPDNGGSYSNCLFAQGSKLVRFSFADPPFDSSHPIDVTVYSVGIVHVRSASVRSILEERVAQGGRDGRDQRRAVDNSNLAMSG